VAEVREATGGAAVNGMARECGSANYWVGSGWEGLEHARMYTRGWCRVAVSSKFDAARMGWAVALLMVGWRQGVACLGWRCGGCCLVLGAADAWALAEDGRWPPLNSLYSGLSPRLAPSRATGVRLALRKGAAI